MFPTPSFVNNAHLWWFIALVQRLGTSAAGSAPAVLSLMPLLHVHCWVSDQLFRIIRLVLRVNWYSGVPIPLKPTGCEKHKLYVCFLLWQSILFINIHTCSNFELGSSHSFPKYTGIQA